MNLCHLIDLECRKQLSVDGFYTKDNAHYCADDYRRLFATKCRTCGELAEGNVITVLGNTYHQQCFNCTKCGLVPSWFHCNKFER